MKKKPLIFVSIIGIVIFLSVFTLKVAAEQGAFQTSKTDRSLIKDLVVGQKEIKSMVQQLNRKMDSVNICK